MDYVVYVLDKEGNPLMPTTRFGKVRRMLKQGKAKAVQTKHFTIRLTYEPDTHVVQKTVLGVDPGRSNIGLDAVREDGVNLYSSRCSTRNKEIPDLMEKRGQCRRASRRGKRKRRQRRARKNKIRRNAKNLY